MSFFLHRFVNSCRPRLDHESLTSFPDSLDEEDATALRRSFLVNESNQVDCAASARLWEQLLEKYTIPFLMIRVADMRFVTSPTSKFTAFALYFQIAKVIKDQTYDSWLNRLRDAIRNDLSEQLHRYKNVTQFPASQKWKDSTCDDVFPRCHSPLGTVEKIQDQWKNMGTTDADILSKYLNLHCLETNVIEGTVQFVPSASTMLVEAGFFQQAIAYKIEDYHIQSGSIRSRSDAILVLQDTRKALDLVFDLLQSQPTRIDLAIVKRLHKELMNSSRVLATSTNGQRKIESLNIGVTRQETRVNVTIRTSLANDREFRIQFCPFDTVDNQLATFCVRFNELMQKTDVDPFAASAWISHVFLTIHPFEDGNGRLSRILASIPLLLARLPPVCIGSEDKWEYNVALNNYRAERDGDYSGLTYTLRTATKNSVTKLQGMISKTTV